MARSQDMGINIPGISGCNIPDFLINCSGGNMESNNNKQEVKKVFEPLEIMGFFWLFFGIIVLIATFFVKETPNVPVIRGTVTNIIAAFLLLSAGIFSIIKGKANKRKANS